MASAGGLLAGLAAVCLLHRRAARIMRSGYGEASFAMRLCQGRALGLMGFPRRGANLVALGPRRGALNRRSADR